MLRIIAGEMRGRKFDALEGSDTRPTLDRVRESLFNIIQNKIFGANVLDLFSGSGALAFEAISRGAAFAAINDSSKAAYDLIKKNAHALNINDLCKIYNLDYNALIEKVLQENKKFDIIFLDPPYDYGDYVNLLKKCVKVLCIDGIIILEHSKDIINTDFDNIKDFNVYDKRKYGKVFLSFIKG